MAVVWKITQPNAGKMLVYPDDKAAELVANGEAQYANESAEKIKPAVYETKEMRAEKPKRRRRKAKAMEPEVEEPGSAESEGDGD